MYYILKLQTAFLIGRGKGNDFYSTFTHMHVKIALFWYILVLKLAL